MPFGWRSVLQLFVSCAAVLALSTGSFAYAQQVVPAGIDVRVLLARQGEALVTALGSHRGVVDGDVAFTVRAPLSWPVRASAGALWVDGREVGASFGIEMIDGLVEFDGSRFRGSMLLLASGDEMLVINRLDLESYLRGVVPSEMSASWPLEALKAQAVAARSYTMTSLDPDAAYDLCATVDCQVYRGVDAEHARTDQAVRDTAGVVVSYAGATARTYYHSDSGGVVASSREVWGSSVPYLVAVTDAPANTPHRSWQLRLEGTSVGAVLAAAGHEVGTVTNLRVVALTESGRVSELEVTGTGGSVVLRGSRLTDQARAWGLKSTRFRVQGGLVVSGDGWGHGVGMSQYGARALAAAGMDFGRILAFYYPNTGLMRFVASGD